ncbi:hypothetical protein PHBOTO_000120 [Pseudozyma hubeiensis]|nr:hypothetical protein PHBOTO_000120 [Pseudozyma hubeiensis]
MDGASVINVAASESASIDRVGLCDITIRYDRGFEKVGSPAPWSEAYYENLVRPDLDVQEYRSPTFWTAPFSSTQTSERAAYDSVQVIDSLAHQQHRALHSARLHVVDRRESPHSSSHAIIITNSFPLSS